MRDERFSDPLVSRILRYPLGRRILRHPLALPASSVVGVGLAGCAVVLGLRMDHPSMLGSALAMVLVVASVWMDRLPGGSPRRRKLSRAAYVFGTALMALGTIPATMVLIAWGGPEGAVPGGWASPETAVMAAGAAVAALWSYSATCGRD